MRTASEDLILEKCNYNMKDQYSDLFTKLNILKKYNIIEYKYIDIMHDIIKVGNKGSHSGETLDGEDIAILVEKFKELLSYWINSVS